MFSSLLFKINSTNAHIINKFQFFHQRLRKNDKFIKCAFYKPYHSSSRNISKITNLRWFALAAVVCSTVICFTSCDSRILSLLSEGISWKNYFRHVGMNIISLLFGTMMGPIMTFILYIATKRFVKYIILHKGGEKITIVTYHLLKKENVYKVPLNEVQTTMARTTATSFLPVKIKNRKLFFLIDTQGRFVNADIFDNTVGIVKKW